MKSQRENFIDKYISNIFAGETSGKLRTASALEYSLTRNLIGSIYDLEQKVEELQDIIYNISERGL